MLDTGLAEVQSLQLRVGVLSSGIGQQKIMSYPVLTPASWARGRYESYVLHPDGTLVGTVHPSGLAFECVSNGEEIPSDRILFLSSHNQKCWGKWFICANLLQPYRGIATGSTFPCELILLLGATSNTSTLLQPDIILHYYSLRNDLSSTAVLKAFRSSSFLSNILCGSSPQNLRLAGSHASPV